MRRIAAPATARPAPVEWQPPVLKKIEAATSEHEVAEAKRMGSALAGMAQKEVPTIKVSETAKSMQPAKYK